MKSEELVDEDHPVMARDVQVVFKCGCCGEECETVRTNDLWNLFYCYMCEAPNDLPCYPPDDDDNDEEEPELNNPPPIPTSTPS